MINVAGPLRIVATTLVLFLVSCAAPDAVVRSSASSASTPPATTAVAIATASPDVIASTPVDFRLPSGCVYKTQAAPSGNGSEWRVDCGVDGNRDARGTLGKALLAQGWTLCSMVTATGTWGKGELNTWVVETSGSPGDYIRLGQNPKAPPCT